MKTKKALKVLGNQIPVFFQNQTIKTISSKIEKVSRTASFPIYNSDRSDCFNYYKDISKISFIDLKALNIE